MIFEITIFALKSNRKNSKSNLKSYTCFTKEKNIKSSINSSDYMDFLEWVDIQEKHFSYNYYGLRVLINNNIVCNLKTGLYNKQQIVLKFKQFQDIINKYNS